MTQKINSFTVVLEKDMDETALDLLMNAMAQMKNVAAVGRNVTTISDFVAQARAKNEVVMRVSAVLRDIVEGR